MRFVLAAIALLGTLGAVSAQTLPACAVNCSAMVFNATSNGCPAIDNKCLCNNKDFVNASTVCIQQTCGNDTVAAEQAAQEICAKVGVNLTSGSGSGGNSSSNTTSTKSGFLPLRANNGDSILAVLVVTAAATLSAFAL